MYWPSRPPELTCDVSNFSSYLQSDMYVCWSNDWLESLILVEI